MIVAVIVGACLIAAWIVDRPNVGFWTVMWPMVGVLFLLMFVVAHPTKHQLYLTGGILIVCALLRKKRK